MSPYTIVVCSFLSIFIQQFGQLFENTLVCLVILAFPEQMTFINPSVPKPLASSSRIHIQRLIMAHILISSHIATVGPAAYGSPQVRPLLGIIGQRCSFWKRILHTSGSQISLDLGGMLNLVPMPPHCGFLAPTLVPSCAREVLHTSRHKPRVHFSHCI